MRKPSKSVLKTLLWVAVVGVAINVGLTLRAADAGAVTRLLSLSPAMAMLLVGVALFHWVAHSLRMKVWARFFGHRLPFRRLMQTAMGMQVGASISPSAIGGEPLKVGMLMKAGLSSEQSVTITLANLFEDLLFFLVAFPLLFINSPLPGMLAELGGRITVPGFGWAWVIPLAVVALLVGGWRLWRRRSSWWLLRNLVRLRAWVRRKYVEFAAIWRMIVRSGRRTFLVSMGLAVVQWAVRYNVATVLVVMWGEPLSPLATFQLTMAVFLVMFFVPTPGAALGAEGAFYAIFSMVLASDSVAVLTVSWRFLTFYLPLAIGALGVLAIQLYDRSRAGASPSGGPDNPASETSDEPPEHYRRTG